MKERLLFFLCALIGLFSLASCGETGAEYDNVNWQELNTHYIDSIATVAKAN